MLNHPCTCPVACANSIFLASSTVLALPDNYTVYGTVLITIVSIFYITACMSLAFMLRSFVQLDANRPLMVGAAVSTSTRAEFELAKNEVVKVEVISLFKKKV